MNVRSIDAFWDRKTRNDINYNFDFLYKSHRIIQTQLNDLVLQEGNSPLEVRQARGGHQVLADRLNSTDQQLAQSENLINQARTSLSFKRDKSVPIGLNDADAELLAAIQGGEGTTFNLESEPRNHSVTAKKTTFARSKNLFDGNFVNKLILTGTTATGFELVLSSGGYTVIQEVEKGKTYTISKSSDSDRFRIGTSIGKPSAGSRLNRSLLDSQTGTKHTLTMQGEEDHIVVFVSTSAQNRIPSQFQIEEGNEATEYSEPNSVRILFEKNAIPSEAIDKSRLILNEENLTFAQKGRNIWNGEFINNRILSGDAANGYRIQSRTGGYVVIQKVKPNTTYTIYKSNDTDRFRVAASVDYPELEQTLDTFFNANDSVDNVTISLTNENYIIVYVSTTSQNKTPSEFQIEVGNEFTEYVQQNSVYIKLDPKSYSTVTKPAKAQRSYIIAEQVKENYVNTQDYQPYSRSTGQQVLDNLYSEWDSFVDNITVTKTIAGNGSGSLPIYQYESKPLLPQNNVMDKQPPKVIYVGGIHGHERFCNYEDLRFFKDLFNNWQSNDVLKMLKNNVHFIVIPVLCPWGFVNMSRNNSNDVDLNRDFPNLTQPESKVIDRVLSENSDAVLFIDHHNFTTLEVDGQIAWFGSRSQKVHDVLFATANQLDVHSKMKFPWLLTDNEENKAKNLYSLRSSVATGLATHAHSHGIPSLILETIGGWGSGYSGTYEDCQDVLVDTIGNIIQTGVTNNEWLLN